MARIRSIKPEFWKNEALSALPEATHLLAAALLNYADDHGYFNANPKLVQAECSPLREPSVSIPESFRSLQTIGYLRLGSGSDGKRYGQIIKFDEHQRVSHPSISKIAVTTITWDDLGRAPEIFRSPPDSLRPDQGSGIREQGTGNREHVTRARDPELSTEPPTGPTPEEIVDTYPDTPNGSRMAAILNVRTLIAAGEATAVELMAAAQRKRRFVEAGGRSDPSKIMGADKFFARTRENDPAPWSKPWEPPAVSSSSARPSPQALTAWELVTNPDTRDSTLRADPKARRATDAIGGSSRIRLRTPHDEPTLKREFCRAYTEAAA